MSTTRFIVFDWDGTAVSSRDPDAAGHLVAPLEDVIECGITPYIVTGTKHNWAAAQLRSVRGDLATKITICCNRGSEVYRLGGEAPTLLYRREMSDLERQTLADVGEAIIGPLVAQGHDVRIISDRLNRIKVDLCPEWVDPPKQQIDEVVDLVNARFADFGGLHGLLSRTDAVIAEAAVNLRVTSDAKHIEIGITDKSHSMEWVMSDVISRGGTVQELIIVGDEFGRVGGSQGSDAKTALAGAAVFSVGLEPNGVPAGIEHLGGGPDAFVKILASILPPPTR